jgi:hypothetical protein
MITTNTVQKERERSIKKLIKLWVARQETVEKAKLLLIKNPGLKTKINQRVREKPE